MATSVAERGVSAPDGQARRRVRMSRFLRILVGITALIHVPVALAVAEASRRFGWPHPWLTGTAWAASGIALFASRARAAVPDRKGGSRLVAAADVAYFIHWCAAVWAFVPSVVATAAAPVVDAFRRLPVHAPMGAYFWSYASGLVVCGYGVLVRRRWYRVVEREVAISGLDAKLDGLRIAHLSDLHIGALTPRSWALTWSRAANRCQADLAVVTGDLVTSGTAFYSDVADAVGELRAKLGVFVSMGNHDYFGDGDALISALRARGARVLRNEGVVLEFRGSRLWVAAVDDSWTRRADLAEAMRDRPAGATTILLAHDPATFEAASEAGAELVLSGHTHGGQIALPFAPRALNLATFVYRYRLGFYRRGRSVLYVHPGLGTTGPPMRLGVAPEVTVLVLRAR
jgi:predicted MPP superfamily phosphohydrolase